MGLSLMLPIAKGRFALGTWQGIYLNEHRWARWGWGRDWGCGVLGLGCMWVGKQSVPARAAVSCCLMRGARSQQQPWLRCAPAPNCRAGPPLETAQRVEVHQQSSLTAHSVTAPCRDVRTDHPMNHCIYLPAPVPDKPCAGTMVACAASW